MNYRIISKLLGMILATLDITFLASITISAFYWDDPREQNALHGWMLSMGITSMLMACLFFIGKKGRNRILRKEALCSIGLGWVLASLTGALPYLLIVENCSLSNAIFESTSGLTTTGASVFADIESFPRSLLFWRCMSQWIGGLGVVVFFVAILSFLGAGAKILYSHESSAQASDMDASRIQKGILSILGTYLFLSLISAIFYYLAGMDPFNATCYMFTSISTGGFATYNEGVAAFHNPAVEWAMIIVMAIGGTNFFFLIRIFQRKWHELTSNEEVNIYYLIILVFSLAITSILFIDYQEIPLDRDIRLAFFQVISIITTSGYSSVDFQQWPPVCHALLLILMIIGGCSGSTAGGLKIIRIIVAIKTCFLDILKSFRPRLVRPIHYNKNVLDRVTTEKIMTYVVQITGIFCIGLTILSLFEFNVSFEGIFSTMTSCLFNIGPGFAEVGPSQNYDFYHDHTKIFLSLIMIMGRLELYAILALFTASLWKRFS